MRLADLEAVAALDPAKRRDVQRFAASQLSGCIDRATAVRSEQIAVARTERVAHFCEQRAQCPVTVVAKPETDRIERIAEHTRKSLQPDLAVGRHTGLG